MGTPEFPDLGKHCYVEDCKQIDFLPFTCDRCIQVFCLAHRSYTNHHCPKPNRDDVTVVICPLCAKAVRLIPDEDANITWERHVNTDCDPSNYEKTTKKKKCPVPRCKESLTFSNTIKCRDCTIDHCLKHRFGPDHNCPGPRKPDTGFPFMGILNRNQKNETRLNRSQTSSSASSASNWGTSFLKAASSFRASAEAGMSKLSIATNQALQTAMEGMGPSSSGSGQMEECPQCRAKFSSVTDLVEHVKKDHEHQNRDHRVKQVTIDACPKCSRGFHDPVELVKHVEKDHKGSSKDHKGSSKA